jgi:ankyrin repeat protein
MQALYTFRLLDVLFEKRRPLISTAIMGSYLSYRVANEPLNGNPLLNCIRRVAKDVFEKQDVHNPELSTVEACIDTICSSLGTSAGKSPRRRFQEVFQRESSISEVEYERLLFAAAIRTDTLPIIQNCVTKDNQLLLRLDNLRSDNLIFGCYDELAARYGSKRVLEFLLTIGVPTINKGLRARLFQFAIRPGRADIVRFLYDFKREEVPWGFGNPSSSEAGILYNAQMTPSLEVLKFVHELHKLYPNPRFLEWALVNGLSLCARAGRLDTIAYLIRRGAHPEGINDMGGPRYIGPIRCASVWGHVAVVEFLLEQGADPSVTIASAAEWGRTELVRRLLNAGITPVNALSGAAAGGYLVIVQLLLDAGVDANESIGSESPLAGAIAKEQTAIFELLLERGADLHSKGTAEECVRRAKKDGLESMLMLLKAHGVDVGE